LAAFIGGAVASLASKRREHVPDEYITLEAEP